MGKQPAHRRSGLWVMLFMASLAVLAQDTKQSRKGTSLWQPGDVGERLNISGWVRSPYGEPIAGAVVHVRQADADGNNNVDRYQASLITDEDGKYGFGTVLPGQHYGVILMHIHVLVTHDDYQPLEARILFANDPNLDPSVKRDNVVFLEQASVEGEALLFGRFNIVLQPN